VSISFKQGHAVGVASGTTSSTTQAFTSSVTKGDLLVICVNGNANAITATDTVGTSYNRIVATGASSSLSLQFFYGIAPASGSNTVTLTWSGSLSVGFIFNIGEFSGVNALDQQATNYQGFGSGPNSVTSGATRYANELSIAIGAAWYPGNFSSFPSGYSDCSGGFNSVDGTNWIYYEILSSTGTQTASWNWSSTAYSNVAIFTFYEKANGAGLLLGVG
jgi:hypothetical protein